MPASTLRRIPSLARTPRPPNHLRAHRPRLFTHNSQLLHIISSNPRPQLPFLYPASHRLPTRQRGGQWQLSRLLTTERKRYIKQQVWLAGKYTVYLWTFAGLFFMIGVGLQNERLERQYPSPPEWKFWTRMNYRNARGQEEPDFNPNGMTDWASTGNMYRNVLRRLEDINGDGKGLVEQGDGGILVPGLGKAGFDIEAKSEPWRRGYFETLMGCGRAAERLDGWVRDNTRNIAFPSEVVIGPSNPNPRPCPPGAASAPLEENCSPAFESPETYYLKIITSRGFTSKQRLEAAIAYADWLDFKGLHESAEEMCKWGFDIACSALANRSSVVDPKTGVILDSSERPTANVLSASTFLATHYARVGNVSAALPIYLSVLRARRSAPVAPLPPMAAKATTDNSGISLILSLLAPPSYPPPPPSGDTPFMQTPNEKCEDASVMMYVGEILYATSDSKKDDGLQWTRQAADLAESGLSDPMVGEQSKRKCAQCASVALEHWSTMVRALSKEAKEREKEGKKAVGSSWKSWLGGGKSDPTDTGERWDQEEQEVNRRFSNLRDMILRETYGGAGRNGATWMI